MASGDSSAQGLWTVRDVARFLAVSPRTVWRWAEQGLLPPPVHLRRRSTRWRAEDIRRFLDALRPGPGDGRLPAAE